MLNEEENESSVWSAFFFLYFFLISNKQNDVVLGKAESDGVILEYPSIYLFC